MGVIGWLLPDRSTTYVTPWDKPAKVEGAVVRLTFTGGTCQTGSAADIEEDSDRVVITVRETESTGGECDTDVGVVYDLEVTLAAPLADRELVDGACEMPEHTSRLECELLQKTAVKVDTD